MPTQDSRAALPLEEALTHVAAASFAAEDEAPTRRLIGLEPEYFAYRVDDSGRPLERVPLQAGGSDGRRGVLEILDDLAGPDALVRPRESEAGKPPMYMLSTGGRLTFEPGAQIEHSSAPHENGDAALEEICVVDRTLRDALRREGIVLASMGLDPWFDPQRVPQQLRAPRYDSMAAYFDSRGPFGRVMMRGSASVQVNLDPGTGAEGRDTYLLANLVSPLSTATFSSSPQGDLHCARAQAWQELDPTRSGFPALLVDGSEDDPGRQYAQAALAADVLLFWDAQGQAEIGRAGFSFERWIREGHARIGYPTLEDLEYHLTTLFLEVRPRKFLEIRAPDALPHPWFAVPALLYAGLLYDGQARQRGLELLEPCRGRLPELWRRAMRTGLADDELAALSRKTWRIALDGAERLPGDFFCRREFENAVTFLERFTERRKSPGCELRAALESCSGEALAWAAGQSACSSATDGGAFV